MSANRQVVFGLHSVLAILEKSPERALEIMLIPAKNNQKLESLTKLAKSLGVAIRIANQVELDRLTHDANHQGAVLFVKAVRAYSETDLWQYLDGLAKPPLLLILDGVQDPHNLGACFRSCDAFGVDAIIAPKDKSVGITPVVSKVACGAAEMIPFLQVTNLVRTMEALKERNIWLYGAAGEAKQTLFQTDFRAGTAIVLGAEGDGLRRLTREHCDALVKIPMVGSVSSLNVSVATGVFLAEVMRQRG